jgi:hypothetical protein
MNQHLQVALYILAASIISGTIGFFAAVFFLAVKQHRIEREAWSQARLFYTRKQTERGL